MSNTQCIIPANAEIVGIGIRISIYVQAFVALICSSLGFVQVALRRRISGHWTWDQEFNGVLKKETVIGWAEIRDVLYPNLILGYALIIASFIQARAQGLGLSAYHALAILNLNWVITLGSIPCWIYALKQHTSKHHIIKNLITLIGHLTFNGVFGLWFFITINTFDTSGRSCTSSTYVDVLGKHVLANSSSFRPFGIAIYSILSIPVINYLFVSLMFSVIISLGVIFIYPFRQRLPLLVLFVAMLLIYSFPVVIFLILTERTLAINTVGPGELDWTFGQTVALLVAIPPCTKAWKMCRLTYEIVDLENEFPETPVTTNKSDLERDVKG